MCCLVSGIATSTRYYSVTVIMRIGTKPIPLASAARSCRQPRGNYSWLESPARAISVVRSRRALACGIGSIAAKFPDQPFTSPVKGAADGKAKVKQLADAGVNIIKLIDQDQMTMEEVKAVVDEAHAHKLPVVAHAHRPEEIRRGLAAGVDCFEHTGLAAAPGYPDDILNALHERTAKMSLGPLFWCPTIEGFINYQSLIENPEPLDDPKNYDGVPPDIAADIKQSIAHPNQLAYYQITPLRAKTVAHKFKQLQDSGVVMLIGTDSGIPMKFHSQSTWHELDAWVNHLGVDSMTAIRAATYWPAVMMKVDKDYGSISEGKFADIIALRGDVLQHIDLLQRVDLIIKHGKRVK